MVTRTLHSRSLVHRYPEADSWEAVSIREQGADREVFLSVRVLKGDEVLALHTAGLVNQMPVVDLAVAFMENAPRVAAGYEGEVVVHG